MLIAASLLLAPGVMMTPVWPLAGLGPDEDDILYYLPSRSFFHEAVSAGRLPQINPHTGLGRPFLADPQAAVWYPFTWLFALVEPLPAYGASLWLHYSLAAWGMYRLLRAAAVARGPALAGGLSFAFSGFMLAHRAHFTMQHAAAWTPWVLWRLERLCAAPRAPGRRLGSAALAVALQILAGHAQIAAMTALAAPAYLIGAGHLRIRNILRCAAAALVAALLCGVQAVPTLLYVRDCTRLQHTYWDFTQNSWDPAAALTLVAPFLYGQRTPNALGDRWWGPSHQCEQFAYAGLTTLLLTLAAMRAGGWSRRTGRGLMLFGLVGAALALGKFGPVCPLLYYLPGSALFRVPARAMLLANLAVAGLAAIALNDLAGSLSPRVVRTRAMLAGMLRAPWRMGAAALLLAVLCIGVALLAGDSAARRRAAAALVPSNPALWLPVLIAVLSGAALRLAATRWQYRALWLVPAAAMLLDLAHAGWSLDVPRRATLADLVYPARDAAWLRHVRSSPHRLWVVADTRGVYSQPARKLAANTNILYGVTSLTDYGPLQPRVLRELFLFAPWGASEMDRTLLADSGWMSTFDVGWVLVCDPALPPPTDGELLAHTAEGWRVFRYRNARGLAFDADGESDLVLIEDRGDEIALRARAGTRVIISRLALNGWSARSGERSVPLLGNPGHLLSLEAPGDAPILLRYQTPGLASGAAISVGAALVVLWLVVMRSPVAHGLAHGIFAESEKS
ncbi:MAG: hypothetical protein CHACPFDD_03555 [Phycisphaerae bacterium]|nr:hypothetical protein [Phycisphaerae bacterium]